MKKGKPTHRPAFPNTRKALRKEKRQQKKKHRQEHYLKKKELREPPSFTPGRFVKRPADGSVEDHKAKKAKQQPSVQDVLFKQQQKEKNEEVQLKAQMEKQRKMILLKANEEEDKVIKKLEKQLGLKKSKNKNNYFAGDGLDYLLEICDRATTEQIVAAEKHLADVDGDSDFEEDLAVVTGKELDSNKKKINKKDNREDKNDTNGTDVEDDLDFSGSESELDEDDYDEIDDESDVIDDVSKEKSKKIQSSNVKEKNKSKKKSQPVAESDITESEDNLTDEEFSEENETLLKRNSKNKISKEPEVSGKKTKSKTHKENDGKEKDTENYEIDELSEDDEFGDSDDNNEEKSQTKEKPDVWEDIYGRKRDKQGNILKEEKGVYIPPHLRNKDSGSEKELLQLKRQIKSVLNKVAGTNLHWACTSIENLYASNSRNAVNTALCHLWLEATVGSSATPDRLVAEHAALVAVLHANVGSEIGAHFLQELSKKFDEMMQTPQPMEDKRLDNLVSCLAHLYSFKIYHASLLYDILGRLVETLSEKHIDSVLAALRSVGGVLRKEEPLALKTFIHDTQARVAKLNENTDSGSRIKFLMDVLLAVKNNNLSKIPGYDPSYVEQLKKMCRGVVRKGNYVTPLNIRLEDLLKADERGKWWVVGSAWEGERAREERPAAPPAAGADRRLLELARQQRMNTDVRRSVFCVLMAAQDYMDAFEKLQQLGLRGPQQREVAPVLLACCLQEKQYNPYYAVLALKLGQADRKFQLSIQYSVWDKIKEIESLSKQALTNLAQFLIHLIVEMGQPLSILKIIQFSDLNKKSVRFMRQILLALIMNEDLKASLEVFHRISKPPKLHMFRESLRLFIQHFLVKNAGKKTTVLNDDEMATLKERAHEVDRILTMHDSKLRL